nr:hypothetical protein [Micromonospora sp. DSM 115978]
MADTIAETVDLLYTISQENLTVDQQIALSHAYAALAQAERLEMIHERLYTMQQLLNNWIQRSATDPGPR